MPRIEAYENVKHKKLTRNPPGGGTAWRTDFMRPAQGEKEPMAFLAEGTPHRVIKPHFHEVDQFQVIVDRKSTRLNSSHVSESRMPSSA